VSTHFLIIGNGAAGYRAAKSLRKADGDAQVSIVTEERHPFYLRRQLGDFLAGTVSLQELIFQNRNAYRRERIDLFLMTRVARVEPASHEVVFASGQRVRYDRLLMATGTHSALPEIPGVALEGVATFDTLSAAQEVKGLLDSVRRAVITAEGVIGLNVAAVLAGRGIQVTQLLENDRFWPQMLDETTSDLVETVLENSGIVVRRGAPARSIIGSGGRAAAVEIASGEVLPAELVLCGCRRRPAVDLLEGSGIQVTRGVKVDAALRTSVADVFAAGDVTEPLEPEEIEPGSSTFCWQRAWAQGSLVAESMLGRTAEPALEAMRVRTSIFGADLAVIGRGHLPEGGDISVLELRAAAAGFRRLVFKNDLLVGAIVFGTGESVHELNRMVAERATRETVETALGLIAETPGETGIPQTYAAHCPICAAELVIHRGTPLGSLIRCDACSTDLSAAWDGRRGWLEIPRR